MPVTGGLDDLTGPDRRHGSAAVGELAGLEDCQTGEDANEREDCRILAVVNSVQAYWSGCPPGVRPCPDSLLRRLCVHWLRGRHLGRRAVLLSGRPDVYIDLGFFEELDRVRLERGAFAQAYVIAHEYGTTSRT